MSVRGTGCCLGPQLELGQDICSWTSKWLLGFVTTWSLGSKGECPKREPGEAEWLFLTGLGSHAKSLQPHSLH